MVTNPTEENGHNNLIFSLQINVATQRGFVPVDERMRVIDANGNLVCLIILIRT